MFGRPKLHFTPRHGWINDPNGLIQTKEGFHLFAQHNPDDVVWGPMHWLHAVSDDMLHWRELGIALAPDALGTMFSGSAVQTGDGRMALMYTAHGDCERQCVAFSDDGRHFEKFDGNPVIDNPGIPDFRDPKVFQNPVLGGWSVVVAAGDHADFYHSENLTKWEKTGEFRPEQWLGDIFECTDCFKLSSDDGHSKWLLSASMIFREPVSHCRMVCTLGEFDGKTFRMTDSEPHLVETGYDSYAGVTFFGTPKPTFMSWLGGASCPLPTPGYCGCLSLPRTMWLVHANGGYAPAQQPVLPEYQAIPEKSGAEAPGRTFVAELESDGLFALTLHGEQSADVLTIRLNGNNEIETERSASPLLDADGAYNADAFRRTRVARLREGRLKLKVVVDEWIVEVYADDGLYAHALLFFARNGVKKLEWMDGASVSVAALQ